MPRRTSRFNHADCRPAEPPLVWVSATIRFDPSLPPPQSWSPLSLPPKLTLNFFPLFSIFLFVFLFLFLFLLFFSFFVSFSVVFFFFSFFFSFFVRGSKSDFFGPQFRYDFFKYFFDQKFNFSARLVSERYTFEASFLFFFSFFLFLFLFSFSISFSISTSISISISVFCFLFSVCFFLFFFFLFSFCRGLWHGWQGGNS